MAGHCEVGILFADVAGSTRLYEALGDEQAHAVVTECIRVATQSVAAHGGIVVKTIGDELMAAFRQPAQMCAAAVDIQRRMAQLGRPAGLDNQINVAFRVGFHFGPALQDDRDFFGDSVNVAARMVALAKANQILTTGEVRDSLPSAQQAIITEFGEIDVKGRQRAVRVARVAWEEQHQITTVIQLAGAKTRPAATLNLRLVFEGRSWHVPTTVKTISCGREPSSDLVLKGPQVSRTHATIERRRDKFVLLDHSSNGTFLLGEDRQPLKLHREEFGLTRQGRIDFGELDNDDADSLWFFIDEA